MSILGTLDQGELADLRIEIENDARPNASGSESENEAIMETGDSDTSESYSEGRKAKERSRKADVEKKSDSTRRELEEGEDDGDNEEVQVPVEINVFLGDVQDKGERKKYENKAGAFCVGEGVDLFDEEKLKERAKRFGVDESEVKHFTPDHISRLYDRSSHDSNLPWVGNVIWLDKISAARALLGKSRGVVHWTVEQVKESISKDGEAVMVVDMKELLEDGDICMEDMDADKKGKERNEKEEEEEEGELKEDDDDKSSHLKDTSSMDLEGEDYGFPKILASDVTAPVPPGHWHLGESCRQAKAILIRFANSDDKKARGAERHSQYYMKYGNPNYGGMKGKISFSRKRRMIREEQRKELEKAIGYPMEPIFTGSVQPPVRGDPWGGLAKIWYHDWDNPDLAGVPPPAPPPSHRSDNESGSESGKDEDVVQWETKSKRPRMRMYADDEQEKQVQRRNLGRRHGVEVDVWPERPRIHQPAESFFNQVPSLEIHAQLNRSLDEPIHRKRPHPKERLGNKHRAMRTHHVESGKGTDSSISSLSLESSPSNDSASDSESDIPQRRYRRSRGRGRGRLSSPLHRRLGQQKSQHREPFRKSSEQHRHEAESDSDSEVIAREPQPGVPDLRAKLNSRRQQGDQTRAPVANEDRENARDVDLNAGSMSPLEIEIDNDEYYKIIQDDDN
ncbi:unnamed protein product [Darwinula stevensoni]|uniref:Nuclear cap-binding protein subunit 3 n=1 Tax=Darwinula stevensoni TaxID=69355 RepID=A0A7R9FQ69_9CRUS|nr:unnamed protein product [Darwinula stevensoni]CAG0898935.1 unnamed protein product [Darwinula stevensoni]